MFRAEMGHPIIKKSDLKMTPFSGFPPRCLQVTSGSIAGSLQPCSTPLHNPWGLCNSLVSNLDLQRAPSWALQQLPALFSASSTPAKIKEEELHFQ